MRTQRGKFLISTLSDALKSLTDLDMSDEVSEAERRSIELYLEEGLSAEHIDYLLALESCMILDRRIEVCY